LEDADDVAVLPIELQLHLGLVLLEILGTHRPRSLPTAVPRPATAGAPLSPMPACPDSGVPSAAGRSISASDPSPEASPSRVKRPPPLPRRPASPSSPGPSPLEPAADPAVATRPSRSPARRTFSHRRCSGHGPYRSNAAWCSAVQ